MSYPSPAVYKTLRGSWVSLGVGETHYAVYLDHREADPDCECATLMRYMCIIYWSGSDYE